MDEQVRNKALIFLFISRGHAGGMKCARRSFQLAFAVDAPCGHSVAAPADTTMLTAQCLVLATSGLSPKGNHHFSRGPTR